MESEQPTATPFTSDERDVWLGLLGLVLRLPPALDLALRCAGDVLLVEYIVLSYLAESSDRSQRMSEIAAQSHLSPSRTTHLVARLERRGLIERRRSDGDGRAITATLTPAGLALVQELALVHAEDARARVLHKLTPTQLVQLREITKTITPKAS